MQAYEIRYYPDPALGAKTNEVENFDGELKDMLNSMRLTLRVADGLGLAAPQVGIAQKVAIVAREGREYVLINPKIMEQSGSETKEEGCLSFPGIFANVTRPQRAKIVAQDENGVPREYDVEGIIARAFLHEIDHLEGKLFIEYLSPLKRGMIRKKMQKRAKESQ